MSVKFVGNHQEKILGVCENLCNFGLSPEVAVSRDYSSREEVCDFEKMILRIMEKCVKL